ncbi:MAG TPA: quinate 5-dehydrogenase, partial [Chloroflexi bacterium]|nr:quinate 5-dehydrogenase [Chloroflexota bacterium]
MKRAVSISLGSSTRDKRVALTLLGEEITLERIGTDGDVQRAIQLYNELD